MSNIIRKTNQDSQNLQAKDFHMTDEEGNDVQPILLSHYKRYIGEGFPTASATIQQRLADAMILRRKRIMYRRSRYGGTAIQLPKLENKVSITLPDSLLPLEDNQKAIAPSQIKSATTLQPEKFKMASSSPSVISNTMTVALGNHEALKFPTAPGLHAKRRYEQLKAEQWAAHQATLEKADETSSAAYPTLDDAVDMRDAKRRLSTEEQLNKVLKPDAPAIGELNDNKLRALANRNARSLPKLFTSCPLCGKDESEIDSRLTDHITGHLRSLAIMSLPIHYDDDIPGDVGSDRKSSSNSQPQSRSTIDLLDDEDILVIRSAIERNLNDMAEPSTAADIAMDDGEDLVDMLFQQDKPRSDLRRYGDREAVRYGAGEIWYPKQSDQQNNLQSNIQLEDETNSGLGMGSDDTDMWNPQQEQTHAPQEDSGDAAGPSNEEDTVPEKSQCWECQRRDTLCDGKIPTCDNCSDAGMVCPGYNNSRPLTWLPAGKVSRLQKAKSQSASSPNGPDLGRSDVNDSENITRYAYQTLHGGMATLKSTFTSTSGTPTTISDNISPKVPQGADQAAVQFGDAGVYQGVQNPDNAAIDAMVASMTPAQRHDEWEARLVDFWRRWQIYPQDQMEAMNRDPMMQAQIASQPRTMPQENASGVSDQQQPQAERIATPLVDQAELFSMDLPRNVNDKSTVDKSMVGHMDDVDENAGSTVGVEIIREINSTYQLLVKNFKEKEKMVEAAGRKLEQIQRENESLRRYQYQYDRPQRSRSPRSDTSKFMVGYVEDVDEDAGSTFGVESTRRYAKSPPPRSPGRSNIGKPRKPESGAGDETESSSSNLSNSNSTPAPTRDGTRPVSSDHIITTEQYNDSLQYIPERHARASPDSRVFTLDDHHKSEGRPKEDDNDNHRTPQPQSTGRDPRDARDPGDLSGPRGPKKARPGPTRHAATQPVVSQGTYRRGQFEDPAAYGIQQPASPGRPRRTGNLLQRPEQALNTNAGISTQTDKQTGPILSSTSPELLEVSAQEMIHIRRQEPGLVNVTDDQLRNIILNIKRNAWLQQQPMESPWADQQEIQPQQAKLKPATQQSQALQGQAQMNMQNQQQIGGGIATSQSPGMSNINISARPSDPSTGSFPNHGSSSIVPSLPAAYNSNASDAGTMDVSPFDEGSNAGSESRYLPPSPGFFQNIENSSVAVTAEGMNIGGLDLLEYMAMDPIRFRGLGGPGTSGPESR
ncbi:hypothetical protein THARTR1_01808 [Trichoderma harzianum]|uniref:Zn(2)-C6 fungal-type domain-containing protein n=1 Tax=Trichoderma harzianum TaxID=5544 RepID=A0A2K0UKH3_TRIHA|nr:hypothetical protein THARTR1_01808 [Trichoderma harzianum]